MKKGFALLLCFLLAAAPAFANVLAPDWQTAPTDDLLAAQAQLANEISARRAADQPAVSGFSTSGNGTAILSGIEITSVPVRITFTADAKATLVLPSKYDNTYRLSSAGTVVELFDETGTYNAMITATGDWSFSIDPIVPGQTLPFSGTGDGVSDFFELPAPTIATISWDATSCKSILAAMTVYLHHQYKNISAWQKDILMNELNVDPTGSIDVILSPVAGRTEYCFGVSVADGITWSIDFK